MGLILDRINRPYQIEHLLRNWIARNKEILCIDIADDGKMITIIYQQNETQKRFIKVEVGII